MIASKDDHAHFLPSSINMSLLHQEVEFIPQPLNLNWSYDYLDQESEEKLIFWYTRAQDFLPLRT